MKDERMKNELNKYRKRNLLIKKKLQYIRYLKVF